MSGRSNSATPAEAANPPLDRHSTSDPVASGAEIDLHQQILALQAANRQLRRERGELLRYTLKLQEEERHQIARELHDEMGQHITALRFGLEALPAADEHVSRIKQIATDIDQSIDRLTLALRPPALEKCDLEDAVTTLAEQFEVSSGMRVDLHCVSIHGARLPDLTERTMYRVLQEALTNVAKHARAKNVGVIIDLQPDVLTMIVEDDGIGFDLPPEDALRAQLRFGLVGMRERLALIDGTLDIEPAFDRGTTLYVRVPLPPVAEVAE